MLRTVLVVIVLTIGWGFALQGPLYAACLYLWIAYFRPESWAWSGLFTTLNLSYIAGAYLVIRTLMSGTRLRFDMRTGLLLLFLGQALLSAWLGLNRDYSMGYWQEFAKVIIVSILLDEYHPDRRRPPSDPDRDYALARIRSRQAGMGTAHPQSWRREMTTCIPFLGDNNLVAVGMAMLLPIVGALAATSTGWQKRAFQFLSVGVLYRGLSTYSRGGFLSLSAVGRIVVLAVGTQVQNGRRGSGHDTPGGAGAPAAVLGSHEHHHRAGRRA